MSLEPNLLAVLSSYASISKTYPRARYDCSCAPIDFSAPSAP